jgi:hypothetical protein
MPGFPRYTKPLNTDAGIFTGTLNLRLGSYRHTKPEVGILTKLSTNVMIVFQETLNHLIRMIAQVYLLKLMRSF